jgi:hypothetical protein
LQISSESQAAKAKLGKWYWINEKLLPRKEAMEWRNNLQRKICKSYIW